MLFAFFPKILIRLALFSNFVLQMSFLLTYTKICVKICNKYIDWLFVQAKKGAANFL